MFGLPTQDDGSRTDPLLSHNIVTGTHYQPDLDALRAAPTRIVIAAGVESEGEMADRGAYGVADGLGTMPVKIPSDHGDFFGSEYGQQGKPDEFAAKPARGPDGASLTRPSAKVRCGAVRVGQIDDLTGSSSPLRSAL